MKAKHIIIIAQALSSIFSPFHLPVVGLLLLFCFSYLSFLPWDVKLYIMCYFTCYYLLSLNHVSHFIGSIVVASLMIQVVCAIINLWWKISTHSAAIGGVTGAFVAFAAIFNFNPVWWICLLLLLAGMVGTSRIILRQHTLEQVVAGYLIGIVCAFLAVVYV